MNRLADYLGHIVEAIDRIGSYTASASREGFMTDGMMQDAVIRNIEIIGEASRNIMMRFADFAAAHPALPVRAAYQMRNAVAHGYFNIDFDIVWNTVVSDLPGLRDQAAALLRQVEADERSV